ncbi:CFEM domain-containing protein [Beauveria bassiana ARSEF 2860]|uniref:CFEM domain-containing protein n=1 Tax=Beauveria bassiana (strain ARSEF 2860) TaxID=655819 RepID=J5JAH4_BEAB2|nr:CFEM domain-containing protein [Beauveria bassiana ARSEF 2860]EJP63183.1 CFEM domain-containing protein [Beauveria bassiana ARSEF 2860]
MIDRCVLGACGMPEAILIVVSLRLVYKQFFSVRKHLNTEEWTLMAAIAVGLVSMALSIFGITGHGFGIDVWGLDQPTLVAFRRYFYVIQIFYVVLMALLKLTFTFFYLNIFSGRGIRALLWSTVAFHVALALAFSIGIVFQCLPIPYQWEKLNHVHDATMTGYCANTNAAGWVNSALSVLSDIWLLSIPLSQLHKLHLHWKKRLGAGFMFMTGFGVTVISCLRLASVRNYASTSNPTWDQWDIMWWSTVEIQVGLICTCLPSMRLILIRLWPRAFGSESSNPLISLNRVSSLETHHTRLFEDEELTQPDLTATTLATHPEAVPKCPEPVFYYRSEKSTGGSADAV